MVFKEKVCDIQVRYYIWELKFDLRIFKKAKDDISNINMS